MLGEFDALLVGNTLEVEDHLREPRPGLSLPLADIVHLLLRRLVRRLLDSVDCGGSCCLSLGDGSGCPLGCHWTLDVMVHHLAFCRWGMAISLFPLEVRMRPQSLPSLGGSQVCSQGRVDDMGVVAERDSPGRHGGEVVDGSRR